MVSSWFMAEHKPPRGKKLRQPLDKDQENTVECLQRLAEVVWPLQYGEVQIKIQRGKATLVRITQQLQIKSNSSPR